MPKRQFIERSVDTGRGTMHQTVEPAFQSRHALFEVVQTVLNGQICPAEYELKLFLLCESKQRISSLLTADIVGDDGCTSTSKVKRDSPSDPSGPACDEDVLALQGVQWVRHLVLGCFSGWFLQ